VSRSDCICKYLGLIRQRDILHANYAMIMTELKRTEARPTGNMRYEALRLVDIKTAIDYFGVTELLDNIGVSAIKNHLNNIRKDNACRVEIAKNGSR
jgi:hypothetical protein